MDDDTEGEHGAMDKCVSPLLVGRPKMLISPDMCQRPGEFQKKMKELADEHTRVQVEMESMRLKRAAQLKLEQQEALEKEKIEIEAALGKDKLEHIAASVDAAIVLKLSTLWSPEKTDAAMTAAILEIRQAAYKMEKDNFEREKIVPMLQEYFFQQSANRSCIDMIFNNVYV